MLIVAIDGPAGSGKSTVAKIISEKFNIPYLDTGAMYRGLAYSLSQKNIDVNDEEAVKKEIENLEMTLKFINGVQHVYVNGFDTTPYIRNHEISRMASDVSKHKFVRIKLVEIQRDFARNNSVVLDGRDIGTYVLPDAKYKFYLTASQEVRAKRRYKELVEKGSTITEKEVLNDINQRDYNDSHREFAPLKKADDAIEIDTSNLNIEEVISRITKELSN